MSNTPIASFERTEYKFLLTRAQYEAFSPALQKHFTRDEYGVTTICNIYYDNDSYESFRHSIDRPLFKEKLRVRSYGPPANEQATVFIELKKKYDGVVYKRRITAPLKEAAQFLSGGDIPTSADPQIAAEIKGFLTRYQPSPKVFLCYDRLALFGNEDHDLRITLDRNLLWRDQDVNLLSGASGTRILPEGTTLMEIKFSGAMPLWLARILSECQIYKTSFSKIGACYKEFLIPKLYNTAKSE